MNDNIYLAFESIVRRFPKKKAVYYLGTSFTYAKLKDLVDRLAQGLEEIGVKEGDSLLLYIPNSVQWVVSWLAAMRAGVCVVPITPIYTPRDVEYIANDSGAKTAICVKGNFGYIKEVLGKTPIERVIVTGLLDLLPCTKKIIGRVSGRIRKLDVTRGENIYHFSQLIRKSALSRKPVVPYKDRLAEILYTGGTTKNPKGVPITHGVFLMGAYEQGVGIKTDVISPEEDVLYSSAPLFHALGQLIGLTTILVGGGTLILDPKLNLDVIFDSIQRWKVKSIIGVPAFYRMILDHVRVEQYDLSSLRYCVVGGDALPQEVANRWQKKFHLSLSPGYGATETCGGVTMTPAGEENVPLRTIGKLLPSKEIKVVDQHSLEAVPVGSNGELLVSCREMVQSYWNKPEETAESFMEIDGKVWYRTADIVTIDKDGWLFFVDRTVDVIKHKGYRISASEIEAVLQEHPAVVGSAVIGIPDKKVGERIKAFIILKEDVKGVTGYDLTKWCRERLVAYKVPQHIEFRDMLPKSKVGKLLRREIRSDDERRRSEN